MKVTVKRGRPQPIEGLMDEEEYSPRFAFWTGEMGPVGRKDVWTDRFYFLVVFNRWLTLGLHKEVASEADGHGEP